MARPLWQLGQQKYLVASLDQSPKRMGLDYVDIFYHHRPDPNTPLEETVRALDGIVDPVRHCMWEFPTTIRKQTIAAAELFKELGTPFIINQRKYSMFVRDIEKDGLKDYAAAHGIGIITFSPLAQGLLTDRYLHGIPEDSRVRTDGRFLERSGDRGRDIEEGTCTERSGSPERTDPGTDGTFVHLRGWGYYQCS